MGDDTEDDLSYTKQPVQELRPATADDVPEEEGVSSANVDTTDVDMDPEDHVNRPDQEDFDPAEREQYQNPPEDVGIKTADDPADR
jgi:hypothetical protein